MMKPMETKDIESASMPTKDVDIESSTKGANEEVTTKKACCNRHLKVMGLVSLGLLLVGAITVGTMAIVTTLTYVEDQDATKLVQPDVAFALFTNKYATVTIEYGAPNNQPPTANATNSNKGDDGLEDYVEVTVENGVLVRRTFRFNTTAHAAFRAMLHGADGRDTTSTNWESLLQSSPPLPSTPGERPTRQLTLVGDKDDRVVVQDIDVSPDKVYGSVVRVGGCSGALVGPNTVVTAYHCLNPNWIPDASFKVELHPTQKSNAQCEGLRIIPYICGWQNGWFKMCSQHTSWPASCKWQFTVKSMKFPAGHTAATHDIALLELNDHNGVTAGNANADTWLTLATKPDSFFNGKTVRATGYSFDKGGQMMTSTGPTGGPTWRPAIMASHPYWLNHQADIVPGNSGGPITSSDERNLEVYAVQAQQSHPEDNPTLCGDVRNGKDCYNNAGRVTETIRALAPSPPPPYTGPPDKTPMCRLWGSHRYCTKSVYVGFMNTVCPATCHKWKDCVTDQCAARAGR